MNSDALIQYLTLYGRSADNAATFDEAQANAADELGVEPFAFEHPLLNTIVERLKSEVPVSVVLTGNAGDGKTNLCHRIVGELGESVDGWDDAALPEVMLPSGKRVVVVKDFTARGENDRRRILLRLAESVGQSEPQEVLLVAANEGIAARWSVTTAEQETDDRNRVLLGNLAVLLEDLLNHGDAEDPERPGLMLCDLSRYPASDMLAHVLKVVLEHPAWTACPNAGGPCPIHLNRERLREPRVQQRLRELVQMLDLDGQHLTIRHLFMVVANALTGHRLARCGPMVTRCDDFVRLKVLREAPASDGAYFQNVFGANLRRPERDQPFATLLKLGVGEETNNRIDQLLVFGDIDGSAFSNAHEQVMPKDDPLADWPRYFKLLEAYRRGATDQVEAFLDELTAQRRRVYFEMPEELEDRLGHVEMTVYREAGNYRAEIIDPLKGGRSVSDKLRRRLLCGLNRIFVGALVEEREKLLLASSGSTSQRRVSNVLLKSLPQFEDGGMVGINVVGDAGRGVGGFHADLVVRLNRKELGRLPLSLSRFEFLMRVEEGVLPASFSVQQYEDVLAFKSQLIRQLQVAQQSGDAEGADVLQVLRVSPEGTISHPAIHLKI